jgi:hypothetical protein
LSAVRSTCEAGDGKLRGQILLNGQEGTEEEYVVSRIPEDWADLRGWPNDWNPENFRQLPQVVPHLPAVFQAVPDHRELARLFGFVSGWFPNAPQ